ncbi:16S rRNA (cytidine(1402)-2'-O)-methyltransferase [uncultured Jatrophihabitans sp.]|uniref:16S rRNA (cytidine(1402)-2'-O)-methyltransferase n=1 Tax=uncultured Jatrophihabitans sp. TaxID=1610747 RepID=UPI0035CB201E
MDGAVAFGIVDGPSGRVVLAATPIGQPGDASARLCDALATAPVLAAEDTRRLLRLCRDLDVEPTGRIVSFFDANESGRVPQLLEFLHAGEDVLVVTDAGMPSVSDPGYRLVAAAVDAGIEVTCLPGPSSVTTALAVSGLPVDRFCFEGFLPRKSGERRRALEALATERRTMVFFEAPHRLADALADLVAVFEAERPAAMCRELTKTHEEIRRGPLADLAAWAAGEVRGEICLVVGGATGVRDAATPDELAADVARRAAAGQPRKEAIAEVARVREVPKREVFDAVVTAKG